MQFNASFCGHACVCMRLSVFGVYANLDTNNQSFGGLGILHGQPKNRGENKQKLTLKTSQSDTYKLFTNCSHRKAQNAQYFLNFFTFWECHPFFLSFSAHIYRGSKHGHRENACYICECTRMHTIRNASSVLAVPMWFYSSRGRTRTHSRSHQL